MKRKIFFPVFNLVLLSLIFFSCEKDSDGTYKLCNSIELEGKDDEGAYEYFFLVSINNQELPFYSYYEDEQNYSAILSGLIILREQNDESREWESYLDNEQLQNGGVTNSTINRSGTFTCDGSSLLLVNDLNQSAGTVSKSGEYIVLDGGSYVYKFSTTP